MKILVPTDFSEFARYAFDAAIRIALLHRNAEIHLYHSATIPEGWEHLPAEVRYKDAINKSIATSARDKMQELANEAIDQGIIAKFHYTGGRFLRNIEETLENINPDLIVMGSHGSAGNTEWFIGSNTQKVLRKISCNILVVKNEITDFKFKNILYASNLDSEDKNDLIKLQEFLIPFESQNIHIISIDTMSFFGQPNILMKELLAEFKAMIKGYNVETHFVKDFFVESGIRRFAKEHDIDLIVMSKHHSNSIKRFFQGSNLELLVNHSDKPVLAIN